MNKDLELIRGRAIKLAAHYEEVITNIDDLQDLVEAEESLRENLEEDIDSVEVFIKKPGIAVSLPIYGLIALVDMAINNRHDALKMLSEELLAKKLLREEGENAS